MPLILPNSPANLTPADGDKLDQNFDTIVSWANQEAITRDGSTAMQSPLLLPGAPTQPNQAATKDYVDTASGFLGEVRMYAPDTEPVNWLFCRGQAISRATYATLYNLIGTRFGGGDGSSTFNLPDYRGRYPFGHNAGGSYGQNGVGQVFGTKDSVLPSHQHGGVDHLHGLGGSTGGASARHTHATGPGQSVYRQNTVAPGFYLQVAGSGLLPGDILDLGAISTGGDGPDHSHGLPGTTGANDRNLNTGWSGSDGTNGNLPPSQSINFIIRVQ